MILADALHYAQSRNPLFILDAATLTGAVSVALGDKYTGLFCNFTVQRRRVSDIWPGVASTSPAEGTTNGSSDGLPQKTTSEGNIPTIIGSFNHCGRVKGDPFWHLPSLYARQLKEDHGADIANILRGPYARLGGSGSAAAFLQVSGFVVFTFM